MHLDLKTGTIERCQVNGFDVLFPLQRVLIDGKWKDRGGAHICCPNTNVYQDLRIPKHGFFRLGQGLGECLDLATNRCDQKTWVVEPIQGFPWSYIATIGLSDGGEQAYTHTIRITKDFADMMDEPMPLSMGFYPYFATHNLPFFINIRRNDPPVMQLQHTEIPIGRLVYFEGGKDGTLVSIELIGNDFRYIMQMSIRPIYSGFYIWTDAIERYICIEPVAGKPGDPLMLLPGDSVSAECWMHYFREINKTQWDW